MNEQLIADALHVDGGLKAVEADRLAAVVWSWARRSKSLADDPAAVSRVRDALVDGVLSTLRSTGGIPFGAGWTELAQRVLRAAEGDADV